MADAAAKREARRRRILENSEYRLQKITGHVNHNDSSAEELNKNAVEAESTSSNSSSNGILNNEPILQDHTLNHSWLQVLNASMEGNDPAKFEQMYTASQQLLDDFVSRSSTDDRPLFDGNALNMHTLYGEDYNYRSSNSQKPGERSALIDLLSSRLVYVILAVVVNIMIVLKLEPLFGTSIMYPFLAVMIGRLFTSINNDGVQSNNILVAALILSNCRPEFVNVIQGLKSMFSIVRKLFRDFAVYIVTFVLLYSVILPYRENPEDKLSFENNAETIFDNDITM